nr:pseudouridine synthase [Pleomorphomonas carboxyditropha]
MIKTPSPAAKAKKSPAKADDGADRIAKVIARAGLCSRREAESWIAAGRVKLNGRVLDTPAITVKAGDTVEVDGQPLPERDRTRLWLFHKPRGTVTTTFDPEGRPTVFSILPDDLPRVMTIGRLDINTEGLLLLTNDGGLARVLELPATGWLRRYRVRAHGEVDQARLDALKDGIAIDGILYGSVEATLDRRQGDNVWLTVGLREGKNREVKTILAHLGLDVNRLIRVSFGPFQLGELADGAVEEVPRRVLRSQLGDRLAGEAGADFELREDDRAPIQSVIARSGQTAPAPKEKAPARPKAVSAAATRKRHEADLDARPSRQPAGRSGGKAGAGKPPVRVAKAEKPQRATLSLKSDAAGEHRAGRLSRRDETESAPRAYKSGKSFEVDRKPRAHGDEPTRVRGDRPQRGIVPKGSRIQDGSPAPAGKGGKGPKAGGGRGGAGKPRGRDADRRR